MDASLAAHVERFNAGVRSGDFTLMLAAFAPDAELVFVGAPAGPFLGVDAIAAAYAAQPPDDTVLLLGRPRLEEGMEVADYAWTKDYTPVVEHIERGNVYIMWEHKSANRTRETKNGTLTRVGGVRSEWQREGWI